MNALFNTDLQKHANLALRQKLNSGIKVQSVYLPEGFNPEQRTERNAMDWYEKTIQSQHSTHWHESQKYNVD